MANNEPPAKESLKELEHLLGHPPLKEENKSPSNLLTVRETAQYLGMHPNTVYDRIKRKEIPFIRREGLGIRFRKEDIDVWLEKGKHNNENIALFPNLNLDSSLREYDKIFLKGEGAVSKKRQRWNYGIGTVFTRKTKRGIVRWYIYFRDENGKWTERVVKNAQSRKEAVIALQTTISDIFNKQHNIKSKPRIKFYEFADMYLDDYAKGNKKSWKTDMYYLRGMKERFGNLYLEEITSHEIEKYKIERLKQGVQPSTINRYLATLRRMFTLAVEWGYLQEEQIPKMKFFSEKDNIQERILKKAEEERLLKASSEHLKPILVVALNTGMRLGEILNLQWNQIDFDSKQIRVEKTKSGKMRFIDINIPLLRELLKLRNRNGQGPYLFFNPKTGEPYKEVKTGFKAACRRAGIENLRFHDLRHTFASRLVEKGADLITVKDLLGHSSVRTTERYTHSNQEQKKRAVELLAEGKKQESLMNISRMDKCERKDTELSHFFSMN